MLRRHLPFGDRASERGIPAVEVVGQLLVEHACAAASALELRAGTKGDV
jgi:hypothetical protein